MSNYRRLISYIYAYEGGVKGKNIGYAKIEIRGDQCRIQVNVKKVYVGSSEIGVYLLSPGAEILLGRIFIRNGAGEFRIQVKPDNVEGSGCSMDQCYGLTIHDVDSTWQSYTTIWEDAVAQAAEIQLADVTAENIRKKEAREASQEVNTQELPSETGALSSEGLSAEILPVSKEIEQELQREQERLETIAPWEETETVAEQEIAAGPSDAVQEAAVRPSQDPVPGMDAGQPLDAEPDMASDRTSAEKPDMSAEMVMYIAGEPMFEPEWMPEPQQGPVPQQESEPQQITGSKQITGSQQKQEPEAKQPADRTESFMQDAISRVMRQIIQPIRQQEQTEQSMQPAQASQPIQPIQPAQASQPIQPMQPAQASQAIRPMQPTQAAQPIRTIQPAQPSQPIQSMQPAQTAQSTQTVQPTQSAQPVNSIAEPENLARLEELDRLERENSARNNLWDRLQRQYTKVLAFDYDNGCEILSIKPQDIGLLPREIWVFGNNSFLLHGYYNYRHLILARLNNPQGEPRYLLGVPGHYFSNEKYMASMFGFPHFVLARKQPEEDGRFGYWYTDIRL